MIAHLRSKIPPTFSPNESWWMTRDFVLRLPVGRLGTGSPWRERPKSHIEKRIHAVDRDTWFRGHHPILVKDATTSVSWITILCWPEAVRLTYPPTLSHIWGTNRFHQYEYGVTNFPNHLRLVDVRFDSMPLSDLDKHPQKFHQVCYITNTLPPKHRTNATRNISTAARYSQACRESTCSLSSSRCSGIAEFQHFFRYLNSEWRDIYHSQDAARFINIDKEDVHNRHGIGYLYTWCKTAIPLKLFDKRRISFTLRTQLVS